MQVNMTQFKARKLADGLYEVAAVYSGKLNNGSGFSFLIRATADNESKEVFAERFDLIEAENISENRGKLFGVGLEITRKFKNGYFA